MSNPNIIKSKYKKFIDPTGIRVKGNEAEESDKHVLGDKLLKEEQGIEPPVAVKIPQPPKDDNRDLSTIFTGDDDETSLPIEAAPVDQELDLATLGLDDREEINLEEEMGNLQPEVELHEQEDKIAEQLETVNVEPVIAQDIPVVEAVKEVPVVAKAVAKPVSKPSPAVNVTIDETQFKSVSELMQQLTDKDERKEFNPAFISLEAGAKKNGGGITLADFNVYVNVSREEFKKDPTTWVNSAAWLREFAKLRKKKSKVQISPNCTEDALLAEMAARKV